MIVLESKIDDYYRLSPVDYTVVRAIVFSQGIATTGVCEQNLGLVLGKSMEYVGDSLHIDFYGVRKLIIRQPEWSLVSIGHVQIALGVELPNVEGNFLVRDSSQDEILRLECRDFDAEIR